MMSWQEVYEPEWPLQPDPLFDAPGDAMEAIDDAIEDLVPAIPARSTPLLESMNVSLSAAWSPAPMAGKMVPESLNGSFSALFQSARMEAQLSESLTKALTASMGVFAPDVDVRDAPIPHDWTC